MFNPREQALIIWLIVFIVYALSIKSVRSTIPRIIKSFFGLFKHPIFIATNIYIISIFIIMCFFKIIETGVIKDYVIWIFSALYPLIFRISIKYFEESFKNIFKETFKLSIIPMFIINEYTLSLWAELFIVPIFALIGGLMVVTNREEKYLRVRKLLNYISAILGAIYIYVGFKEFSNNFSDASKIDFWEKMFIEIIGIVLHIPLLFVLQYICIYDQIILRTKIKKRSQKLHAICIIFLEHKFKKQELLGILRSNKLWSIDTLHALKNSQFDESGKS